MNRVTKRIELLFAVFFLTVAAIAVPKTADMLPPDTTVLIEFANFSELTQQFKQLH